jgi:hypothetical protein
MYWMIEKPALALTLTGAILVVLSGCGGRGEEAGFSTERAERLANPALDIRFADAVENSINTTWSTWASGEEMGRCLIANAESLTKESKESVIDHGIEDAFDKLSGAHLQSLGKVWDLCEAQTTAPSTPTAVETGNQASPTTKEPPVPAPPSTEASKPLIPSAKSIDPPNKTEAFNGLECTTSSNPRPEFTHSVISEEHLGETMPPGLASTGMLKPHGYFFVKHDEETSWTDEGWSGYPRSVPVYAPVTSWLRSVNAYTSGAYGAQSPEPPIEYMLLFEVSCEVYYKLDHLGPLSGPIDALGPFPLGQIDLDQPVKIEGGELVSYWSGVNPGGNVDIGVYNKTIEHSWVNQDRYADGFHDFWLNEDCPFDYFPAELREEYYSLFVDKNSGDMVGARPCRTSAESDVAGTVQGAWFEPEKYGSVFAISTSMAGLVLVTFQEHAETGGSFDIKIWPGDATYVRPAAVTSEHCYQGYLQSHQDEGPIYVNLELIGPMDLQLEYGEGTCADRTPIETLVLER